MKLYETNLPQNYSKGLFEEKNFDLAAEHTDKIAQIVFSAVSDILKVTKNKEYPVAFEFTTLDGRFVAAAIAQCNVNEGGEDDWMVSWTFYEKDIPEGTKRYSFKDPETFTHFRSVAGNAWGIEFKNNECIVTLSTYLLEQIKKWLDENAKEDVVVEVEQPAVFLAQVKVVNGEKEFALIPEGETKSLTKNNAAEEK